MVLILQEYNSCSPGKMLTELRAQNAEALKVNKSILNLLKKREQQNKTKKK